MSSEGPESAEAGSEGTASEAASSGEHEEGKGDQGIAAGFSRLVEEAVELFDSLVSYLADLIRLEGFRLGTEIRTLVLRAVVFALAGIIGLIGLVFVSLGIAAWLAMQFNSVAAGLAIVGTVYMAAAVIASLIVRRRSPGFRRGGGSVPPDEGR